MTPEQADHLERLTLYFLERMERKYRKGAEEHSGDLLALTPRQLVAEALDEALDKVVYLARALELLDAE